MEIILKVLLLPEEHT